MQIDQQYHLDIIEDAQAEKAKKEQAKNMQN